MYAHTVHAETSEARFHDQSLWKALGGISTGRGRMGDAVKRPTRYVF